ncbi:MAG: hypothetical protein M0P61_02600 [Ignavibacteriaceae bacterium]|jgi:hypothetical protein|nr:hypothetical protein [Ignavibacteriaceae bacterium]
MISKTVLLVFLWGAIVTSGSNSQVRLKAIGGQSGLGMLSGNSPQIFSYSLSFFSDVVLQFSDPAYVRLEIIYMRDFNALIPGNRQNKYYPLLKGGSLQILFQQQVFKQLYFEEGFGPLILNDKTYSDVNTWNYGAVFSFSAGINFFENEGKGFSLAVVSEFGNTFTQTTPQFLFVALQPKYNF